MIDTTVTEDLEQLAAALLPEQPLYLLFESEGFQFSDSWGLAGRSLDISAQEGLSARGRWVGRRPAIYIADQRIATDAAEALSNEPQHAIDRSIRDVTRSVLIHEIGHVAEVGVETLPITPELRANAAAIAGYSAAEDNTELPPWRGHSLTWLRATLHARFRAAQIGVATDLGDVVGQDYGYGPLCHYWREALPEMKALVGVPLMELATIRPAA
ncbi:MAG TPA: hypothetical protein VL175_12525, partial [Pirellulales bacterium]|nr:hypothetical protein [Pirellulales bacterium]